jgi:hypothetical protein
MSKHTPGPWTYQKLNIDGTVIRREGYEISTPDYDVCAYGPHGAPIRLLADACLIAAAPGLLEALEGAIEAYANILTVDLMAAGADYAKACEQVEAALEVKQARAAIAKAKGVEDSSCPPKS